MKQATAAAALMATGASAKVMFQETFEDMTKWTASSWKSDGMHDFDLKTSKYNPDDKDTALSTTENARFYASSAHFDSAFSTKGKSLLVQYEATYDTDVECGGGYLKIGPKQEDPKKFGDPTEYAIMFGPDKCGHTKRTHLIFNYKGKNKLKKTDLPYKQDSEGLTTLYRMILTPENKVKVSVNDAEIYSGEMEKDWDLLEPKEIDDPDDKKPSDWVDEAMIDDPEDKKPADWVEEKEITDPDATKPDDWDEEEDGAWEAPMKPNPDYKGEWKAKRISNPAYKGVWKPKRIANPKYEEDKDLYLMNKKDLAFVGFDLWQVKGGSLFDNIIIATAEDEKELVKEADERKAEWKKLAEAQKKTKDSTTTTTTTTAPDDDEEDKDDDGKGADDKEDEDL